MKSRVVEADTHMVQWKMHLRLLLRVCAILEATGESFSKHARMGLQTYRRQWVNNEKLGEFAVYLI